MKRDQGRLRVLYKQAQFPIFQNRMYETAAQAVSCPKGDIVLVEDQINGLVYNAAFSPELMEYDSAYQNEQGNSSLFDQHLEQVRGLVEEHLGTESIIEVGCGKGLFLEKLLNHGVDITGFDPTYEGNNGRIEKSYFSAASRLTGKGLILRHVLEHIQDPFEFLLTLCESNGGQGRVYIEVPCFDWILKNRVWFDIFYEHVNYFRMTDFYRMFSRIVDSGYLFGGQYLYVIADLEGLRRPVLEPEGRVEFPDEFSPNLSSNPIAFEEPITIWGGASKGVIYSLLAVRHGIAVRSVIDINPQKQGKYLAGTGLLVESPESSLKNLPEGREIYVMNSNYLSEIKSMSNHLYKYIEVQNG